MSHPGNGGGGVVYPGARGYFALLLPPLLQVFAVLHGGGLGALQLADHGVPLLHAPAQLRWRKEGGGRAARIVAVAGIIIIIMGWIPHPSLRAPGLSEKTLR